MTLRNRHPLGEALHLGLESDSAIVLSGQIGPFSAGTSVHDMLVVINNITEAIFAPSMTANAVLLKTITHTFSADARISGVVGPAFQSDSFQTDTFQE